MALLGHDVLGAATQVTPRPPLLCLWLVCLVSFGCGDDDVALDQGPDASLECVLPIGETTVDSHCEYRLAVDEPSVLEIWVEEGTLTVDGRVGQAFDPFVLSGSLSVRATSGVIHVRDLGPVVENVTTERSLLLQAETERSRVGLHRIVGAASERNPGEFLHAWFSRFSTTAHSERVGPLRLLDAIASEQGDPAGWDLDAAPFAVTGAHNRIDLRSSQDCGEFRVSFASTDPVLQPFHILALFRQKALPEDLRPDGTTHCVATALRWARLSAMTETAYAGETELLLNEILQPDHFIAFETVEFLISPWEWRQWFLDASHTELENRPLFQTVDTVRLNRAGQDRTDFLEWVSENAEPLWKRNLEIPERFRAKSARVNDGVPWIPLDLTGVPEELLSTYPDLGKNIEIVGCPACHAADAPFVHTQKDRTLSPFLDKELQTRERYLVALSKGEVLDVPKFGPLQRSPLLP